MNSHYELSTPSSSLANDLTIPVQDLNVVAIEVRCGFFVFMNSELSLVFANQGPKFGVALNLDPLPH